LWCSYVNDPAASPLRVAFSVGRAVGPATVRNLVRRRLRALVTAAADRLDIGHGWLLIGTRPAAAKRTFAQLAAEVTELLTRTVVPAADAVGNRA